VWKHYEAAGRHDLPWRRTRDPYTILVSEVMLQQTQVERVKGYYTRFLEAFPTVEALASAPLAQVLTLWQGLGYNRRAKMLHQAAQVVSNEHRGRFPKTVAALEALPGVGHYTARAVAAFAYNQDVALIETNIRTAFTHHFYPGDTKVSDRELMPLIERTLPKGEARTWYAALMDYGSFLKRSGVRINARATGYTRQSAFKGSSREARGAVLKALSKQPEKEQYLLGILGPERVEQVERALATLVKDGMVERTGSRYRLPH
jgi:A/G-specific adenine glycosylase